MIHVATQNIMSGNRTRTKNADSARLSARVGLRLLTGPTPGDRRDE